MLGKGQVGIAIHIYVNPAHHRPQWIRRQSRCAHDVGSFSLHVLLVLARRGQLQFKPYLSRFFIQASERRDSAVCGLGNNVNQMLKVIRVPFTNSREGVFPAQLAVLAHGVNGEGVLVIGADQSTAYPVPAHQFYVVRTLGHEPGPDLYAIDSVGSKIGLAGFGLLQRKHRWTVARDGRNVSNLPADRVQAPICSSWRQGTQGRPDLDFTRSRLLAQSSGHDYRADRCRMNHRQTVFYSDLSQVWVVDAPGRTLQFLSEIIQQL